MQEKLEKEVDCFFLPFVPITIGRFLAKKLKFTSLNCVAKKEQKKVKTLRINSSIDKRVEVAVFKQNCNKEFILVPLFQFTSRIYYRLEKKICQQKEDCLRLG